nr:trypsin-like peptidase domain-containing protein [Derxia gummosa]
MKALAMSVALAFALPAAIAADAGSAPAGAVGGSTPASPAAAGAAGNAPLVRGLPDFADLVERAGPAVVNIRTVANPHAGVRGAPDLDELLRRHFGTPDAPSAPEAAPDAGKAAPGNGKRAPGRSPAAPGKAPSASGKGSAPEALAAPGGRAAPGAGNGAPGNGAQGNAAPGQPPSAGAPDPDPSADDAPRAPRGVGSGFIVGGDGEILTNAHVVADAEQVIVRLDDRREFTARVVGLDRRTDVALLRIDATGLPVLPAGDATRLRVGEWVIAIGSPFDLDNSVTAGIVSARARETGELLPFIQTDVAINPGNSGGPLINLRGEVVGINSQIYSRSGGYQGISFAIPIDEALRVADQLRSNGRVIRSRIGVAVGEVTNEVVATLGLTRAAGALVSGVEVGSPADNAGVVPGDVITGVDAKPVERWNDLPRIIGAGVPGGRHKLRLIRAGQPQELAVRYAELEPEKTAARPEPKPEPTVAAAAPRDLGIGVSDITAADRRALQLDRGAQIVRAQGLAERAGLRPGDILLSLGGVGVHGTAQFEAVLDRIDTGKPVSALVRREQWTRLFVIRPRG